MKKKIELKTITKIIAVGVFLLALATVSLSGIYVFGIIDRMSKPEKLESSAKLHIEKPNAELLQAVYGNLTAKPTAPARDFTKIRDAFNAPPVPAAPTTATSDLKLVP